MELSLTPVAFDQLIYTFRGTRVMVDYDLANAYDVATKVLNSRYGETFCDSRLILCLN